MQPTNRRYRVTNFSSDVKDGENYTVLLNQLAPETCSRSPLQTQDVVQRAEQVLTNADKLGCRKFLTPLLARRREPEAKPGVCGELVQHYSRPRPNHRRREA
jgi:hypothetical protein